MKKVAIWLGAVLGIILLAAIAATGWLLGTTEGARFLLLKGAESADINLQIGRLEGRLLDVLRLEDATVEIPHLSLRIKSLRLQWNPAMLLAGNLAVKSLDLRGMDIRDTRPRSDKPVDLSWPTLSGPAIRLNGWISSLTLRDLSYRQDAAEPTLVSELTGQVDWHGGQAALTRLVIRTPAGTVAGDAGISFRKPLLNLFATVTPREPVAGFSRLLINAEIASAKGTEQAAGRIRAMAATTENRSFHFSTDVGISSNSLRLSDLSLTERERQGKLGGKAKISLAGPSPGLTVQLRAEKLDLSSEIPALPPLDGTIDLTGTLEKYRGTLRLATSGTGIRSGSLGGTFSGSNEQITLALDKGSWLGGTLTGNLAARWSDGFFLSAALRGRNMLPSRISAEWEGVINLDANGEIRQPASGPLRGKIAGKLLASRLRGRSLTGELAARIEDQDLLLDRLLLSGKGFDITAAGNISRKINFALLADDLGGLVPGTTGDVRLRGQVSRKDGRIGGTVTGNAKGLRADALRVKTASFSATLSDTKEQLLTLHLTARSLGYEQFMADEAQLDVSGNLARHWIALEIASPSVSLKTSLEGTYKSAIWAGNIVTLSGKDTFGSWRMQQATPLFISSRRASLAPLVLNGASGERLELSGEWSRTPAGATLNASWQKINLARIGQWIPDIQTTGSSSGSISILAPPGSSPDITGTIQASGSLTAKGFRTQLRTGVIRLETVGRKIHADASLDLMDQGRLTAEVETDVPKGPALPDYGDFQVRLDEVNLKILRNWLPEGLSLDGIVSASTSGKLLPDRRLQLTAKADIARGILRQQQKSGEIRAELSTATLNVNWRDQSLDGTVVMELADTGHVKGSFRLPLPARLPTAMNPDGAVSATLEGKVRENGIMTALFPGMIQESKGELEMAVRVSETWQNPDLSGTLRLGQAGFYLPRAGIRLTDLKLAARLERDRITVDSFSGRSGPGTINGTATVRIKDWKPDSYQGTIRGDRFQFVYLPELQVLGSPRLQITGNMDKVTVRGDLVIPELTVSGRETPTPVRASEDVVIVDAPRKKERSLPLDLDVKVKVVFGDKVFVKMAGIDARLAGTVDVTITDPNDIRGKGEIRTVKGSYKAYGVNLDIEKGRVIFNGGPVAKPTLDILAVRTVKDVSAGVIVVGTITRPIIRLYSEPAMPDGDIMGYMVLGQPLSGDQGQINAVMQAAGLLLSASESAVLNEQIITKFGIDTLGVEQDKSDITKSLVTVGKYLTPKLFVSYGRSLFSSTTYLKARYTFSERWEVETWTGTESGVDIFYKINFN
jgi:translocation and assembly module TamB